MLNRLAQQIHDNAERKGFHRDGIDIPRTLCLIHSEVSEALEADRKQLFSKAPSAFYVSHLNNEDFKLVFEASVKSTFEDEMADIIIRVLDLCSAMKIDIDSHIAMKMRYNETREYKHGKEY